MCSGGSRLGVLLGLSCLLAACAVEKSENPLSPSVAGPIPGVGISAPTLSQPAVGAQIRVEQQPVTLSIGNSTSTGVRPLVYAFQVAADAGFSNIVFSREGVTPGDDGTTSLRLSDPLASGRTYYWRSKAQDGANESAFSATSNFTIFTPVVLDPPTLVSPSNNDQLSTNTPRFVLNNSARSGPAGPVSYLMELSDSASFGNIMAAWVFTETPNQSGLQAPIGLGYGRTFYWRARADEASTTSPWSSPAVFRTPAPPAAPPPSSGGGGGGGGGGATVACAGPAAAADQITSGQISVYNSPLDLPNWCIGAKITSVTFRSDGFGVDFNRREGSNRWPDYVTPGWDGPLQYTLGMCLQVSGGWACSAVVEFWYGRGIFETAPPSHISLEWFYDGRWGPLAGRQPSNGETVGLFVCAGDCRNTTEAINKNFKERSNVVLVPWSNGGGTSYTF
jgi:hypothetical protein